MADGDLFSPSPTRKRLLIEVPFSQYGAGNYLAHIAIVDKDKRLDTHIPFSVGLESVPGKGYMLQIVMIASLLLLAYIVMKLANKEAPNHSPGA